MSHLFFCCHFYWLIYALYYFLRLLVWGWFIYFSSFDGWKLRWVEGLRFYFSIWAFIAINLPTSTASALSYRFCFLFLSGQCILPSMIPFLTYELFRSVFFNTQPLGDFSFIFLLLLSSWLHYGQRKYFQFVSIPFHLSIVLKIS